jgi:F-type H+-transporting ATPase subunit k
MLTLGSLFVGSAYAMSGEDKKKKDQGPPINASSKEEENFIQYVHASSF